MPSNEQRSKNISLITYLNKDEIQAVIQKHSAEVQYYAFILHDKDTYVDEETGEIKTKVPHYHIVLHFFGRKTVTQVREWFYDTSLFTTTQNTLGQIVIDIKDILDYLTHCKTPDKYQYNIDDIVSNNRDWIDKPTQQDKDTKSYQILCDILDNTPFKVLCQRYGREFIIYHENYLRIAEHIRREDYNENDT